MRWILADAHGGADPTADAGLIDVLDLARGRGADLLLLGDLFAAWLAAERFLTPLQREVVARLRALRREGRRVEIVAGNRDYLLREGGLDAFDVVIDDDALMPLGGVPTLVAHGDRINREDRLYALWRAVSRSGPSTLLLRAMPPPLARRLAARLEAKLARTNRRYKSGNLPRDALQAFGRHAATRGARRALLGHFHADTTIEVEGGVPVVIAPAWLDHRRILTVEPGGALRSIDPFQGAV